MTALLVLICMAIGCRAMRETQSAQSAMILASQIVRGAVVTDAALATAVSLEPETSSCWLFSSTDALMLRVRSIENMLEGLQFNQVDRAAPELAYTNQKLLACEPTRSYGWLVHFWIKSALSIEDGLNWNLLELSYMTGLNEGWVAARRNRLALAAFDTAPEQIRNSSAQEFQHLVEYGFLADPARRYVVSSTTAQNRLDEAVSRLSPKQKKSFAREVETLQAAEMSPRIANKEKEKPTLNGSKLQ